MRRRSTTLILSLALLLSAAAGGCGSAGPSTTRTSAVETIDAPAALPAGWSRVVNAPAGFSINLPPGWSGRPNAAGSLIRSPDHLIVILINADRTDAALAANLNSYATAAIMHAPGFNDLKTGAPRTFASRYQAVQVKAGGRAAKTGVQEKLELVVMRREHFALYAILIARNATRHSPFRVQIDRILQSFRGRPVEVPATGP